MSSRRILYQLRGVICLLRGHRYALAERVSADGGQEPVGMVCSMCWDPTE